MILNNETTHLLRTLLESLEDSMFEYILELLKSEDQLAFAQPEQINDLLADFLIDSGLCADSTESLSYATQICDLVFPGGQELSSKKAVVENNVLEKPLKISDPTDPDDHPSPADSESVSKNTQKLLKKGSKKNKKIEKLRKKGEKAKEKKSSDEEDQNKTSLFFVDEHNNDIQEISEITKSRFQNDIQRSLNASAVNIRGKKYIYITSFPEFRFFIF